MKAVIVELPAFSRFRADYLTDETFRALQNDLMGNPEAGDMIEGERAGCGSCARLIQGAERANVAGCG